MGSPPVPVCASSLGADLRNKLTAIVLEVDLASETVLSPAVREALANIRGAVWEAVDLSRQVDREAAAAAGRAEALRQALAERDACSRMVDEVRANWARETLVNHEQIGALEAGYCPCARGRARWTAERRGVEPLYLPDNGCGWWGGKPCDDGVAPWRTELERLLAERDDARTALADARANLQALGAFLRGGGGSGEIPAAAAGDSNEETKRGNV